MHISSETEFLSNFLSSGREDWIRSLGEERGKVVGEDLLYFNSPDGIEYSIYQDAVGYQECFFSDREIGEWEIRIDIDFTDFEVGISRLKNIRNGLDVVGIFARADAALKWNIDHMKEIYALLSDDTSIVIDCGVHSISILKLLQSISGAKRGKGAKIYGPFDPLGDNVWIASDLDRKLIYDGYAESVTQMEKNKSSVIPVKIGGNLFRNSGASIVQELAYSLSVGVEILFELGERGVGPQKVLDHLYFQFSTGSEFYLEIAKYRAFRILWRRILREFGCNKANTKIHAVSSEFEITRYEKYSNLIRMTFQSLSSVVGGADIVSNCIHFFVEERDHDRFALLSRDFLLILKYENSLFRTADPVFGSPSFSEIVRKMCENAWDVFQKIERRGGIIRAFKDGSVKRDIEKYRMARKIDLLSQKRRISGINCYVDHNDILDDSFMNDQQDAMASRSGQCSYLPKPTRLSSDLERLRIQADRFKIKTGIRPVTIIISVRDGKKSFLNKILNIVQAAGCEPVIWNMEESHVRLKKIERSSTAALILCNISEADFISFGDDSIQNLPFPLLNCGEGFERESENLHSFSFENDSVIKIFCREMFDRLSSM